MAITEKKEFEDAVNNSILKEIYPDRKKRENIIIEGFDKSKERRKEIEEKLKNSDEGKNYDTDSLRQKSLDMLREEENDLIREKTDNLAAQYLVKDYIEMISVQGQDPADDPILKSIVDDYYHKLENLEDKIKEQSKTQNKKESKEELKDFVNDYENFFAQELRTKLYSNQYPEQKEKFSAFFEKRKRKELVDSLSEEDLRLFKKQSLKDQQKTISLYRGLKDSGDAKKSNLSFKDVVRGTIKGAGAAGWLINPQGKAAFLVVSALNRAGVFDPLKNTFKKVFQNVNKKLAESKHPKMAKFGKFLIGATAVVGGISLAAANFGLDFDDTLNIGKSLLSGDTLEASNIIDNAKTPEEVIDSVSGENLNTEDNVMENAEINENQDQMDTKADAARERVEEIKKSWNEMTPEEQAQAKEDFAKQEKGIESLKNGDIEKPQVESNESTQSENTNSQTDSNTEDKPNNDKPQVESTDSSVQEFTSREYIQQSIFDANDQITNPDRIYAGDTIKIPTSNGSFIEYEIQKGDTLSEISERFAVSQELVNGVEVPEQFEVDAKNDFDITPSEKEAPDYFAQADALEEEKMEYLQNNIFGSEEGQKLIENYNIKSVNDFSEFLKGYENLSFQEQREIAPFMDELAKNYPEHIDSSYVSRGQFVRHSIDVQGLIGHMENETHEASLSKEKLDQMSKYVGEYENLEENYRNQVVLNENAKQDTTFRKKSKFN